MSYKPGSVVGDYVVIGAVGTGGMGTVYKVQHVITQRIEAMKLLASGRSEPEQEQRFLREMQVQARLHHPNIAAVYNAFRFYDEFFLVLEFIEGESLESVLERGRLPLATSLNYARQALFALGYAHAHGVVHRDIAPANMIITPDGTVKLTDFGLAKTTTDIRLTHSGAPLGSPWYMSPEQVRGDSTLDARSDIYSLGVVLYEITTGSKPFNLASTFDVMRAHVEMAPLAPIERTPDLPQVLNQSILTALAKDPGARFQSAEQFCAALDVIQTPAASTAAKAALPAPIPQHSPIPRGAAKARPPLRRQRSSLMRYVPRFVTPRMLQTAAGSAACGLALFGGYATYAVLRPAAAEAPIVTPAKPSLPAPAPLIPPALPPAPAETTSAVIPPAEPDPPAAQPVARKVHKVAALAALPPISPAPLSKPLPQPAVEEQGPRPAVVIAPQTLAATPVIARPAATADVVAPARLVEPPAEPPVATGPPEAPADSGPKAKKEGNRFWKAFHKVVPFRKPETAETSSGTAPENQ